MNTGHADVGRIAGVRKNNPGSEGEIHRYIVPKVLALVAEGKTNKEIAGALELSDKTVKNYLSHVFEKLNVSRRTEAAAFFARRRSQAF